MKTLAPVAYFAYNRPLHTRQTLEALHKNTLASETSLWIFLDGAKAGLSKEEKANIEAVRKIASEKQWCKEVFIIASETNRGLFGSLVNGITKTVNEFGKIIVIEDDVLISEGFLEFMNDALAFYEHTDKVMHISGFSRPDLQELDLNQSTYFFYHTSCWGWGTWKRAWDNFIPDPVAVQKLVAAKGNINKLNMDGTHEFYWGLKAIADGKFQSWNCLWHSAVFLNDGLALHPAKSLVSNIGHDGSGTNCVSDEAFATHTALVKRLPVSQIPLIEHAIVRKMYKKMHSLQYRVVFFMKHYLRYIVWR
jgi:GR25 family glycosyltransferase involved in LPS biosynthesis